MRPRSRTLPGLVLFIVALLVLASTGPVLVAVANAAVPLTIAVGLVVLLLRVVWHHTNRY